MGCALLYFNPLPTIKATKSRRRLQNLKESLRMENVHFLCSRSRPSRVPSPLLAISRFQHHCLLVITSYAVSLHHRESYEVLATILGQNWKVCDGSSLNGSLAKQFVTRVIVLSLRSSIAVPSYQYLLYQRPRSRGHKLSKSSRSFRRIVHSSSPYFAVRSESVTQVDNSFYVLPCFLFLDGCQTFSPLPLLFLAQHEIRPAFWRSGLGEYPVQAFQINTVTN